MIPYLLLPEPCAGAGVVQAWVLGGTQCNIHNPTLGLSRGPCLHTTSDNNQMRSQHTNVKWSVWAATGV